MYHHLHALLKLFLIIHEFILASPLTLVLDKLQCICRVYPKLLFAYALWVPIYHALDTFHYIKIVPEIDCNPLLHD